MKLINPKHLAVLLITCFFSMTCFAQTKIWGAGALQGTIEGEFQTNFIDTALVGAYSDTAWTALSIYDSDTILPGNAYWTRSLLGYSLGAYSSFVPLPSPSQGNGIALFDSDFMDNGGIPGAWATGTAPSLHRGELISPLINLSGYMDTAIMVRFFSEYKALFLNELSVSMSVDSGLTWGVVKDYRLMQDTSTPGWIRVSFPTITAGISNLNNCRLRFAFEGDYYYAMVDDVSIEVAPDYDIAIARPNPHSSILAERGDYVKIGNNRYVACLNLLAYDIDQWLFGLRAINHGAKDLLPSDSARIMLEISYEDPVVGSSVPGVYLDTIWLGNDTLKRNGLNSHFKTDNIRDINFIFIYGAGDYVAKYWVEHKHADAFSDNDTVTHRFMNTEYVPLYNYTSKARLDPVDGKVQATSAFFPPVDSVMGFEYGAMFYFPRGFSEGLRIDSIDFRYYVPEGYVGDSTFQLLVNVYRFIDGSFGALVDGNLDSSNLELVYHTIAVDSLMGLGTSQSSGVFGLGKIDKSSFLDPGTGGPVSSFVDNGYYIVTIARNFYNPLLVNPFVDSTTSIWMGMDDYNYAMNRALTNPSTIIPHSLVYATVDTTGQRTWTWQIDHLVGKVPSIGIHLGGNQIAHNNKKVEDESIQVSIHPNPSSDILNVKASFEKSTDAQYIITDATGRVVRLLFSKNVSEEIQSINIKKLPAGIYYLTVKSLQGEQTEPFVKK